MPKVALIEITGQVQGVGLRYTVFQHAKENNYCGWIRNEPHGTVLCCLQDKTERVDEFISWLKEEKKLTGIHDVKVSWNDVLCNYNDFIIKY